MFPKLTKHEITESLTNINLSKYLSAIFDAQIR